MPLDKQTTKSRAYLYIAFSVAVLATIFDAVSSWQIIELDPIALEGNPIWNAIAHSLGFGGAMVLRAFVGVFLLGALLILALRSKNPRLRRISSFGIYFSAVVLTLLACYHLYFRMIYG